MVLTRKQTLLYDAGALHDVEPSRMQSAGCHALLFASLSSFFCSDFHGVLDDAVAAWPGLAVVGSELLLLREMESLARPSHWHIDLRGLRPGTRHGCSGRAALAQSPTNGQCGRQPGS